MNTNINTYKIVMAPTAEIASTVSAEATVEAEYGNTVVKGSIITLAHHKGEYQDCPAPCNTPNVPVLPDGSTILVSHIDLDTVGGIMQLTDRYTDDPEFWAAAEYIDLNGQHHVHELSTKMILHLNAYWAWAAQYGRAPYCKELTDVTELVNSHIDAIIRICDGDPDLIMDGQTWAINKVEAQEACLLEESESCRIFITDDFSKQCPTAYFSPKLNKIIPTTITLNTAINAITMGCCDGSVDVCDVAQTLWGDGAGGRAGIAGSPRNQIMTESDLYKAAGFIKSIH